VGLIGLGWISSVCCGYDWFGPDMLGRAAGLIGRGSDLLGQTAGMINFKKLPHQPNSVDGVALLFNYY